MSDKCPLTITNSEITLEVSKDRELSRELDATNSPILFGCRTGICGTCLVVIEEGEENTNDADADELEFLEIVSEDPKARLACKMTCQGPVKLKYIGK